MARDAVDEYVRMERDGGMPAGALASLMAAFSRGGMTGYLRRRVELWTSVPQTEQIRFAIAQYSARLGDRDRTFGLLDALFAEHSDAMVFLEEISSFDAVHDDPRFSALLRRVGLPQ